MHSNNGNKDLLKTAMWVCAGLLIGALGTAAISWTSSPHDANARKSASSSIEEPVAQTADDKPLPLGPVPIPSANPCTAALSTLNAMHRSQNSAQNYQQNQAVPQDQTQVSVDGQTVILAPGTSYAESSSGYPIYTGSRAVDSAAAEIPYSNNTASEELAPQQIGRNGLVANPCADPPSSHGVAYSRQKAY